MDKCSLVLRSLFPAVALWVPLVLIGFLFDAAWPSGGVRSEAWQNFITFVLIVTFLWTKSWLILRRMPYIDWLSISLAAANFAFCALYLVALLFILWPSLIVDYPDLRQWLVLPIRTALIVVLIWSTFMLVTVPEPIYDSEEPA